MTPKISPTKKSKRFEKLNCGGKIRVEVKTEDGEIVEVYLISKGSGCKSLIESLGRFVTLCFESNLDPKYILEQLGKTTPCIAPLLRMKRENLKKEDVAIGGCVKAVKEAIEIKLKELCERQATNKSKS